MDSKLFTTLKYDIVKSEFSHIKKLADNLRPEDRRECKAMGLTGFRAILNSFKTSMYSKTVLLGDEVAAMFGVGGTLLGTGYPWLLTSNAVERAPASFLRETKNHIHEMLNYYTSLSAVMHNDYEKSLKFFSFLGFELSEPFEMGKPGELWRRATLEEARWELAY